MMIDFNDVKVINTSGLNEEEIINLAKDLENKNKNNKILFLFFPYDVKAELKAKEEHFVLSLSTFIENKEDMEYFLENIVNINNNYSNLVIEVKNHKTINNLNIPKEIIEMS